MACFFEAKDGSTMRNEICWNLTDQSAQEPETEAQQYVWSTSEQARLRALSLFLIRSIVEKYGGTLDVDLVTDTLNIDVPKEHGVACAQEIEKQVGRMCC
jgi:sensor histidine kinase regulating citrate/malate metabolism